MTLRDDLEDYALDVLKDVGLKSGYIVLDCCCGYGNYSIPASKLVGEDGTVYAIDIDNERLEDLKNRILLDSLDRIKVMQENVEEKISLSDNSVDIALLYDIFWYFRPNSRNLSKLLKRIYRVIKPQGLISVFPAHITSQELHDFKNEMRLLGFHLKNKLNEELIHERRIESGVIYNYQLVNRYKGRL